MARKPIINDGGNLAAKSALFREPETAKSEPTERREAPATAQEPAETTYKHITFVLDLDTIDKIKDYAYTARISIKDAIKTMVDAFIDEYQANPENEPLLKHKKGGAGK